MRLIDADALINYFCVRCGAACNLEDQCCSSIDAVENAPTINPDDLRPQGRWLDNIDENGFLRNVWRKCSACGGLNFSKRPPYCPNCGAKMEGKENEDA